MSPSTVMLQAAPRRRRFGCKGPLAESWLQEQGFSVPPAPNSWSCDASGVLVARLATSEFLVEALEGASMQVASAADALFNPATRSHGVYPVLREDRVLELAGPCSNDVLLETCNVNFAPIAAAAGATDGPVILTLMVGVGVIVILRRTARGLVHTIWCDPSYGEYLQSTLEEVSRQEEHST
jgi:sarcosine oxidase subunit gamma